MASQNIIETINTKEYKIEIYQDSGSKFRWRATQSAVSIGSSEQGFKTLEQCRSNLNMLASSLEAMIQNRSKKPNLGTSKVEVMTSEDYQEDSSYSEENKAMDWNIFWLMVFILLLSLFIFVRIFIFR